MGKEVLNVPLAVLVDAQAAWAGIADALDGVWRQVGKSPTAGFSAAVRGAVTAFQDTWIDEIKGLGDQAQRHGEAIRAARDNFGVVDSEQADRIREMLPWSYHDKSVTL